MARFRLAVISCRWSGIHGKGLQALDLSHGLVSRIWKGRCSTSTPDVPRGSDAILYELSLWPRRRCRQQRKYLVTIAATSIENRTHWPKLFLPRTHALFMDCKYTKWANIGVVSVDIETTPEKTTWIFAGVLRTDTMVAWIRVQWTITS